MGIALHAVTVDQPNHAKAMKVRAKLSFGVISDPEGGLMDRFGLRHTGGGPGGSDIPRPASVLLDAKGTVLWKSVSDNYRVRPKPAQVLESVKKVFAELPETGGSNG